MAGASVSLTVTVKLQFLEFPAASVAVQVTVLLPFAKVEPEAGAHVTVGFPGQLSVAVGVANVTTAEHCPRSVGFVIFPGQLIVGASVSLTVTVKLQFLEFPAASVAVHVTVLLPFGKVEPEAGTHVTVGFPGQLSVAVGVANVTTAEQCPRSLGLVIFPGQLIVGASVSLTVTVKLQFLEFPAASVAVHVTVLLPFGKV